MFIVSEMVIWFDEKRGNYVPNDSVDDKAHEQFLARRERYAGDFDKTVKPYFEISLKMVEAGRDYGKLTVSYLFAINSGGLAGIIALYPVVREHSQTWFYDAATSALLFCLGLVATAACAGVSYLNFTQNATHFMGKAYDDDLWLKQWHFRTHRKSTQQISQSNQQVILKASAQSKNTARIAVGLAVFAAASAASAGMQLLWSLSSALPN